jgi:hypothetical protein
MSRHEENGAGQGVKRGTWQRPELRFVGNVGRVLQTGGGKLSPTDNDPGENRKPKGSGA